jgi:hypothetical protein
MDRVRLHDEPSSTEVCGLTMRVEYMRGEGVYAATLSHRNLGSYTSHGRTPAKAREAAREQVAAKFESLMAGHEQRHSHEVN